MTQGRSYQGGENFNLQEIFLQGKALPFRERMQTFSAIYARFEQQHHNLYRRVVASAADREVEVLDDRTGKPHKMLMFGSNNYLGLANHPHVKERVAEVMRTYGVGIGGPPMLNGYSRLHQELEERISAYKRTETTIVFSTGYGANIGLVTALVSSSDVVLFDEYSHASFLDGLRMRGVKALPFRHNDLGALEALWDDERVAHAADVFIGVEGVYSMDGDLAPLDRIAELAARRGALLVVDDAHGAGVLGKRGSGTVEHFGVEGKIDVLMGTFSKTFGVVGGFVSASRPIVEFLRIFARSYMFSSSLPPVVVAAVLAGLDVIEREPELCQRLHDNVVYAAAGLRRLGFDIAPEAGIITLRTPPEMDIRRAAAAFHAAGIFVNCVEHPAVPMDQQRFRISMMATHTHSDIDRLLACVEEVWATFTRGAPAPPAR